MLPSTQSESNKSQTKPSASQYPQIGKNDNPAKTKSNQIEVPSISLPKGGGAIKSIDEKFQVNAANGTASFGLPLPLSPGRSGFTPSLSLNYNSGGGNSIAGLGWSIETPSIQRKTDKKLPEYRDEVLSDTFMYSGAEDLVPLMTKNGAGDWQVDKKETADGIRITRFRPRIEGGFAKIEWIQEKENTWWRVTTKDNVVSVFGQNPTARIADPEDPKRRVFQWFLEYSYDDKGNFIHYQYKPENSDGVAQTLWEKNRLNGLAPTTNTYLKRIRYGNTIPYDGGLALPEHFLFEVVLDYGEHDTQKPSTKEINRWPARQDAYSDYRPGFEVRTWRLCRRVLMFHHFREELGFEDYLVRSLDLVYEEHPHLTYLEKIVQTGYIWNRDGSLLERKSLPPLEFRYFKPGFNTEVKAIALEDMANAPIGLDERNYQWMDLYSEGISGILSEQANGWYYKENLGEGHFAPAKLVTPKPSFGGTSNGNFQIQDLEANGKKYLVSNELALRGYFELSPEEVWQPFRSFEAFPTLDLRDPNVKFLDLNGDGLADILISQDQIFHWYASKGKVGYDDHRMVQQAQDEERGPRILFANKDERMLVALADMSGDGMSDIVRITESEVCYWPNLGYGRFGAKVTLGYAAAGEYLFAPDGFHPQYLHFADIDGSGTTDLIYIGENKIKIWFNQSGNCLSEPSELFNPFPKIDNLSKISVIDLLGNGTSCLVWSSPLPHYAQSPLQYIDLMGGRKPHVMGQYLNNLGKEITMAYKPSTWFYLQDKKAGKKWATKLPFPVQCVHKTVVMDKVSQTRFVQEYSYHHGYYDGEEREFRGFALVEQRDTEAFENYVKETTTAGALNTVERELYQPAVITKSWFHTGAYLSRDRVYHQLQAEYYPDALVKKGIIQDPEIAKNLPSQRLLEAPLPKGLCTPELLECLRALKGLPLRQEVYSDEGDEAVRQHPYSVVQYNYDVQLLQPMLAQKHAVFFPFQKEALTFHYERNPLDPRVAHNINIEIDEYGNVRQSAAIVYGRRQPDMALPTANDRAQQTQTHITYTENHFTNKVDDATGYRLPLLCETLTWELKAAKPATPFYEADKVREAFESAGTFFYHDTAQSNQKRKIEHIRNVFLKNDLSDFLPLGRLESLALPGQAYQLALTPDMLPHLYGGKVEESLLRNAGHYVRSEGDNNFWIASGRVLSYPDLSSDPLAKSVGKATAADLAFAKSNFYLPVAYEDNFGHLTKVFYDPNRLFVERAIDAADNETVVEAFHYRTLAPWLLRDPNGNRSGVRFDALGLVHRTFVMGKAAEQRGDFLFLDSLEATPQDEPTTRLEYEFRYFDSGGKLPNRVKVESREQHYFKEPEPAGGGGIMGWLGNLFGGGGNNVPETNTEVRWQTMYSYSDGSGHEVLKKVQAEPGEAPERDAQGRLVLANGKVQQKDTGDALRWVGNGRTILNNKGNPVKQYEPFFDSSPEYNDEAELVELGFTPVLYYDAVGRLIRTEKPNDTYSKVAFDAWMQRTWDENDTVKDSRWYTERIGGQRGADEKDAAQKTEICHDTPTTVYQDSLGRTFLSIAHNRTQHSEESLLEEFYLTRSEYDLEGNVHSVTDARGNVVMRWYYDMLGNVCRQESMDAGMRWQLNDAMGKPLRSWDSRQHVFSYEYDDLHRPTAMKINDGTGDKTFEKFQYGETVPDAAARNLRGKPWKHFDTAGVVENIAHDFKGNPLQSSRTLLKDYKTTPDWANNPALENETFTSATRYDALNRPMQMTLPDKSIVVPEYNEANLLESLSARLRGSNDPTPFVTNIDYNAKGQRTRIQYANDTTTRYDYEPETDRLIRLLTTAENGVRVLQDLNYTYDPVGNITRQFDNAQKTVFYGGQRVEAMSEYLYDALYRLIEAGGREHSGQLDTNRADDNWDDAWAKTGLQANNPIQLRTYTQQYFYDGVGNILRMRHQAGPQGSWTRNYQYNPANNQLTKTIFGTRTHAYTYNAHGSMAAMPHLKLIEWNFKEEMYHVDLTGGGQAWYVYDSSGQRTRKVIERLDGTVEERIYLGAVEIYRERKGNTLRFERETLYVMDDKQRIAMVETRTKGDDGSPKQLQRYQYANHLSTACLEVDETGRVISYEEYHPYGTTAYQAVNADIKAAAKRYRYTGMERDEETGLNYHSARYYAGWLGRWTAADPIGVGDGVNVYQYVKGNSISLYDLSGNSGKSPSSMTLEEYRGVNARRQHPLTDEQVVRAFNHDRAKNQSGSRSHTGLPSAGGGKKDGKDQQNNPGSKDGTSLVGREGTKKGDDYGKGTGGTGYQQLGAQKKTGHGGTSKTPNPDGIELTELDYAVLLASLLAPIGGTSKDGVSGGIPGGFGPKSGANAIGQVLYIAVNLIFTFFSGEIEAGIREGMVAAKVGLNVLKEIALAPFFIFMGAGGIGGGSRAASRALIRRIANQRGALRKAMGIGKGVASEAHHLVPIQALKESEVVQAAVTAGFDINGIKNGVELSNEFHHAGHSDWNKLVIEQVDDWAIKNPGYTPQQAKNFVENQLIPHLRDLWNSVEH